MRNDKGQPLPLLEVKNIYKRFPVERNLFKKDGFVEAVRDVSFSVRSGEIVALVGESGSGKSTIGKCVQGLLQPDSGEILFNGENGQKISRQDRAHLVQTIFQDPYASLNPKLSVGAMLQEAIGQSIKSPDSSVMTVPRLLESVGLAGDILNHYPHQFSGGQRQRLGVARALALNPKMIVADEPVSALDLSVQAQILNLLIEIREQFNISYLMIVHDLSIVRYMADQVLVIQDGRIVERGPAEKVFQNPQDRYTQKLLSAVPALPI